MKLYFLISIILIFYEIQIMGQSNERLNIFPYAYHGKWGVIDDSLNIVLKPIYDSISQFYRISNSYTHKSMAIVFQDGIYNVINEKFEKINNESFESIFFLTKDYYTNTHYFQAKTSKGWGILYWKGKLENISTLRHEYDKIVYQKKGDYLECFVKDYKEYRTLNGLKIDPFQNNTEATEAVLNENKLPFSKHRIYNEKSKLGLKNLDGQIFTKAEFDNIEDYYFCPIVKKNGKYGVLNRNYDFLLPPIFESITRIDNDIFLVKHINGYEAYYADGKLYVPKDFNFTTPKREIPYPVSLSNEPIISNAIGHPLGWDGLVKLINAAVPSNLELVSQSKNSNVVFMFFIVEKDGKLSNFETRLANEKMRSQLGELFNVIPQIWEPFLSDGIIHRQKVQLCFQVK